MKKVTIRINEIDPILKIPRPCWLPKDWYKENENPLDYFDELDRPFFEDKDALGRFTLDSWIGPSSYNDHEFEITETPTSNYFYVISTLPFDFWDKRIEYDFIPKEVLKDISNGKCKIVFYMDDDGHWFSTLPYFYNSKHSIKKMNGFIKKYNFKKEDIIFLSHNIALEDNSEKYNFTALSCSPFSKRKAAPDRNKMPFYVNYSHCEYVENEDYSYDVEKLDKVFLAYNNRVKSYRIYLIYQLLKNNLLDKQLWSFCGLGGTIYFEETEERLNEYFSDNNIEKFDKKLFTKVENLLGKEILSDDIRVDEFPGEYYGQYLQIKDFEKTFFSLVTESEVADDSIYFSEKMIKPLIAKHPFILISSKGTIKKLKELGFKTFDKWWDESYDECDYFIQRIDKIVKIVQEISNKPKEQLVKMREEMKDICNHNQKLLFSFNTNPLGQLLSEIKF